MTNDEKAEQMVQSYCVPIKHWIKHDLISVMEWKDKEYNAQKQQLIDIAVDWLDNRLIDQKKITEYTLQGILSDFKKFMKKC